MPSMTQNTFVAIAQIQHRFYSAGWRWEETTYNDSRGTDEVRIRFSPSHEPQAFSYGSQSDPDATLYGWGRFERLEAWMMAERFLLEEQHDDARTIERLREYKSKWGVE